MHGSDIDSYVQNSTAPSTRLVTAGPTSSLQKIQRGLATLTRQEVLTHVTPAPATLAAWKQKARERQTVYKELKNAGSTRSPWGDRPPHSRSGPEAWLHNYQTLAQRAANPAYAPISPASQSSNWRNQVVPMDVDAGQMDDSQTSEKNRPTIPDRG